jgi:hypothetical protein
VASVAQLLTPVFCTFCGAVLTKSVRFRWGRLPDIYRVGEPIRWWRKIDGSIEPSFQRLGDGSRWNFGDPACEDVLLLDEDVTDAPGGIQCPHCGLVYEGIEIRISNGIIRSPAPIKIESIARLRQGSVGRARAFEVKPDHSVVAREDWHLAAQPLRDPYNFESASASAKLFNLMDVSVALEANGVVTTLDHRETMWIYSDYGVYGEVTRIVSQQQLTQDWTNWEMHPSGDEIVVLLDGDVEVQIEGVAGDRASVVLDRQGSFVRISRGAWHIMNVRKPSRVILVTPVAETRQRSR